MRLATLDSISKFKIDAVSQKNKHAVKNKLHVFYCTSIEKVVKSIIGKWTRREKTNYLFKRNVLSSSLKVLSR